MAYIHNMACCGVGEVAELSNRNSIKRILEEAKRNNKGMLVVYFAKARGSDKFRAAGLMEKMLRHGFQKSGDPFVNPNSGNTIQPLHYIIPKKEKANTQIRGVGWGDWEDLGYAED